QHVDAAKALKCRLDEPPQIVGAGHVGLHEQARATSGLNVAGDGFGSGAGGVIVDDHLAAGGATPATDGGANATAGAGYDDDLSVKSELHGLSLGWVCRSRVVAWRHYSAGRG